MASVSSSFLILALSLFVALSHAAVPECGIGTFRKGMKCLPCPQGMYQGKKGATECIPCPKGFFNPFTGAPGVDICKPCKSGTFSTTVGAKSSAVCKPCPSGESSPEGADRCLSCPAGTFLSKCPQGVEVFVGPEMVCVVCVVFGICEREPLELKCRPCEERSFTARPNSLKCDFCPDGTISGVGASSCKRCPPGKGNANLDGICQTCDSFLFNDGSRGFCNGCPDGFRGNKKDGATMCVPCPAGTAGTSGSCNRCQPGENTSVTGATSCVPDDTPCPSNFFRNFRGICQRCKTSERYNRRKSRCDQCPRNTQSKGGLDTKCVRCPRGEERSNGMPNDVFSTQLMCTCKLGLARTPTGRCERCAPGFFRTDEYYAGDLTNGNSCLTCAAGTFSDRPGSANCRPCPPGSSQPRLGQTKCVRCPSGTVPNRLRKECLLPATGCPRGTTRRNFDRLSFGCDGPDISERPPCSTRQRFVPKTGKCKSCPAESTSKGGRATKCTRCNSIIWGDKKCKCVSGFGDARELIDGVCRTCGFGTIGVPGVEGCTKCPAGTFRGRDLSGDETCELCEAGTFSRLGAARCSTCSAGTNTFDSGAANCVVPGSLA